MSEVKKLTDEQVKMLIEDGTLDTAINLAKQSKEAELENKVSQIVHSANQAHCLPIEFINKYKDLAMMACFGMPTEVNTAESVYLYRNLLVSRYNECIVNLIHDAHNYIKDDLHKKYPAFNQYDYTLSYNLLSVFANKLADLGFMNYFIDDMTDEIIGVLTQSAIERIAYQLSSVSHENNGDTLNVPVVAYSYFDDIAIVLELIILTAKTYLHGMAHSGDNISQELSNLIMSPLPYDMSVPLNNYYNSDPEHYVHNDNRKDIRVKRLYTRVPVESEE